MEEREYFVCGYRQDIVVKYSEILTILDFREIKDETSGTRGCKIHVHDA